MRQRPLRLIGKLLHLSPCIGSTRLQHQAQKQCALHVAASRQASKLHCTCLARLDNSTHTRNRPHHQACMHFQIAEKTCSLFSAARSQCHAQLPALLISPPSPQTTCQLPVCTAAVSIRNNAVKSSVVPLLQHKDLAEAGHQPPKHTAT